MKKGSKGGHTVDFREVKRLAKLYVIGRTLDVALPETISWRQYGTYFRKCLLPAIIRVNNHYGKLFYYCVAAAYNLSHLGNHIIYVLLRKVFKKDFDKLFSNFSPIEREFHTAVFIEYAIKRGKYRKRLPIKPKLELGDVCHIHTHENEYRRLIEQWMKEVADLPINKNYSKIISNINDLHFRHVVLFGGQE
ncbi:MAG: hypothetical protein ACK4S8_14605 [Alishewanella aestuarii]